MFAMPIDAWMISLMERLKFAAREVVSRRRWLAETQIKKMRNEGSLLNNARHQLCKA